MLKLVHDLPVRFCKVSIHPFVLDRDHVSDLHHLFAEDSIKQMLQTFLCSGLHIGTVATFDRQKLPSLPLASNPLVASRFHTTMSRFNAVAEAAQSPPETSQVQADFMRFALQSNLSIRMRHDVPWSGHATTSKRRTSWQFSGHRSSAAARVGLLDSFRRFEFEKVFGPKHFTMVGILDFFQEKLEEIMGKKPQLRLPLAFQGVDSQLAIEIQSQLKELGVEAFENTMHCVTNSLRM